MQSTARRRRYPVERKFLVRRLRLRRIDVREESFQAVKDPRAGRSTPHTLKGLGRSGLRLGRVINCFVGTERYAGLE
jgi:hypothetical protein